MDNQGSEENKYNRVDILTQNSKHELLIIEIQNTYEIDYFHRMAYGVSKAMSENLSLGQPYSESEEMAKLEATIEIAKKMLLLGLEITIIAQSTGLTTEEIEKLRVEIKNNNSCKVITHYIIHPTKKKNSVFLKIRQTF